MDEAQMNKNKAIAIELAKLIGTFCLSLIPIFIAAVPIATSIPGNCPSTFCTQWIIVAVLWASPFLLGVLGVVAACFPQERKINHYIRLSMIFFPTLAAIILYI